ncbi:MAG: Histidyl-tRNA synthetase [Bacteroidetes bacterium]|nr:Histidyl-tRNA synthetase [Bacteroidota bacterium]
MAEIKKIKPSLPKGTRDFLPEEVAKRNYIFDTIKRVFRKYGFQQIDTPAIESLETLEGKYGDEGDKLLFKIRSNKNLLDRPEFVPTLKERLWEVYPYNFLPAGSEKGLRYDLTVPLARYVVQHQGDLAFPFKRFHIAPVWRGDRPQKGRYQEFYQCDADIIGSTSLLNEVELTQIYVEVFERLRLKVIVEINHRKVLEAIASYFGLTVNFESFTIIIDKLDKIGWDKVVEELTPLVVEHLALEALSVKSLQRFVFDIYNGSNSWFDVTDKLYKAIPPSDRWREDTWKGIISTLQEVLGKIKFDQEKVKLNPYLARGLSYYTGIIWEVVLDKNKEENKAIQMGSLGGGGRYDNLTEMFGGRDMSGVGISFGIERIYDVMEELKLFPADLGETTKVLFVHFDEASEAYAFEQLQKVRALDIASEIYPGKKKLDKQMNYANDKKIPYVIVVGGDEMASGKLTFKDMASGQQEKLTIEEIIEKLKGN